MLFLLNIQWFREIAHEMFECDKTAFTEKVYIYPFPHFWYFIRCRIFLRLFAAITLKNNCHIDSSTLCTTFFTIKSNWSEV